MDKPTGRLAYACSAMPAGQQPTAAGAAPLRKLLSNSSAAARPQTHAYIAEHDQEEEEAHSGHEQHHHHHGRLLRKLRMADGNSSAGLDPLVGSGNRQLRQFTQADLADPSASSLLSTGSMGVPLLHR